MTHNEIEAIVSKMDRSYNITYRGWLMDIQWVIRSILKEVFNYGVLDYRATITTQVGLIIFSVYQIGEISLKEVSPDLILSALQEHIPNIIEIEKWEEDDNSRYMELFGVTDPVILRYSILLDVDEKDE